MIIGRNIGDHDKAAREERESGIGWQVYDTVVNADGSVIVGIHPQRNALRHAGFAFAWMHLPGTDDLLIPAHDASAVVAALHAIGYGARVSFPPRDPEDVEELCTAYRAELVRQLIDLDENPDDHTSALDSEVSIYREGLE